MRFFRSLRSQVLLAVFMALGLAQLAGFLIAFETRETALRNMRIAEAVESAAALLLVLDETPKHSRKTLINAAESPLTRYRIGPRPWIVDSDPGLERHLRRIDHAWVDEMRAKPRISFRTERDRNTRQAQGIGDDSDAERSKRQRDYRRHIADRGLSGEWVRISLPLSDGLWLNTATAFSKLDPSMHWLAVLSFGLSVILIGAVLWIILSRLLGPLRRLAEAADAVGKGEDVLLPVTGPSEIRALTEAFNMMQQRLNHLVQGRTQMLAALGHDLRSPLTALKLRVEMLDDDEAREKLTVSLDEMSHMVEQTLIYARGVAAGEAVVDADLTTIMDELVNQCRFIGCDIAWTHEAETPLRVRPMAIRRALRNLLENACRYGSCPEAGLAQTIDNIIITISDRGPGIPETELGDIFNPFVRSEGSRSRETGGTGLGLSIARGIIQFHGGDIDLSNRQGGGLTVTVTLPKT